MVVLPSFLLPSLETLATAVRKLCTTIAVNKMSATERAVLSNATIRNALLDYIDCNGHILEDAPEYDPNSVSKGATYLCCAASDW